MTVAFNKLNKLTNQFTMIFCKCLHLEILTERPTYCSCFQAVRYPLVPRIHSWSGKWVTLNFKLFCLMFGATQG